MIFEKRKLKNVTKQNKLYTPEGNKPVTTPEGIPSLRVIAPKDFENLEKCQNFFESFYYFFEQKGS